MTAAKPRLTAVVPDPNDDRVVVVTMENLTVGEIEDAEELAGVPITHALDPEQPKGRIMRAVGCVVRRRTTPDFSWEQAKDLLVFFGPESAVPPTSGRGSGTKSRSRGTSRS